MASSQVKSQEGSSNNSSGNVPEPEGANVSEAIMMAEDGDKDKKKKTFCTKTSRSAFLGLECMMMNDDEGDNNDNDD